MIMDETVDMVPVVRRLTQFYAHESCGKCTPCREGTTWLVQILSRMERGQGDPRDINTLTDACDNIFGRAFCALADGAVSPIVSGIKYFPEEFAAAATPKQQDPSSNGVAPGSLAGAH
jgi:NADH-quinone oxidoreductase subunit F